MFDQINSKNNYYLNTNLCEIIGILCICKNLQLTYKKVNNINTAIVFYFSSLLLMKITLSILILKQFPNLLDHLLLPCR